MSEGIKKTDQRDKADLKASVLRNKGRLITFISLVIFTISGFGVIVIYSSRLESNNLQGFAILCLCAFACLAIGAIVGFIFGIPRILQSDSYLARLNQDQILDQSQAQQVMGVTPPESYRQQVNTNLEQISDWVTKIFVGVGLIQLQSVPGLINRSSFYVASAFVDSPESRVFAAALIIYFPIVGFLIGYILTRLFLASQFGRADVRANL